MRRTLALCAQTQVADATREASTHASINERKRTAALRPLLREAAVTVPGSTFVLALVKGEVSLQPYTSAGACTSDANVAFAVGPRTKVKKGAKAVLDTARSALEGAESVFFRDRALFALCEVHLAAAISGGVSVEKAVARIAQEIDLAAAHMWDEAKPDRTNQVTCLLRSLAANKDVRAFDEPATLSAYEMPAYRSAVELLGLEADEVEDVREETLEAQEAEDGEAAGVSGTAESEPEAEQSSPQQEEAAAEPVAEAAAAGSQVAMATATEATAATEPPAPAAPAARTASAHNFATVREAKTELSRIMGISVHSSSELSGTEVKGELHRASTRYVCHSCKSGELTSLEFIDHCRSEGHKEDGSNALLLSTLKANFALTWNFA